MNSKKIMLTFAVLLILSMMPVSSAAAEAPREYFSATSTMMGVLDPGTTQIHDQHVYVRGMTQIAQTCWTFQANGETECYREVVKVNVILSLVDLTGPMWGTFKFLDDADNVIWKGTFTGSRRVVDGNMVSTVSDIGHGLGSNEGLLFRYTIRALNIWNPADPATFVGSGYVQETGR